MLPRLLVFAVAAIWLVSSICNARNDMLLMSPERVSEKLTFYPVIPFDTAQATIRRYKRFIANMRQEVVSGDTLYGIPVLQNPEKVPNSDRFLQVALYNSAGARIIVAIDKTNTYLMAYRTEYKAFFFPDTNGSLTSSLFSGIPRYIIPFDSSIKTMEKIAGPRKEIALGMGELDKSIQYLHDNSNSNLASSLIVVIQMLAQALIYRYVENVVVEHITDDVKSAVFYPSDTMITFENSWQRLSNRIHRSVGGVIYPAFVLSNVSEPITSIFPNLRLDIAVIRYASTPNVREPTVRIIGRNGLCVDVQDAFYDDGNPIILWPCKSNSYDNQLWTLMKDGTIRSKGKCLTAYRLDIEQYLMIHNCTTVPKYSGTKWEIQDNGNVINKESKLALTAYEGYSWSLLTLDQKSYTSSQGWSFRNNTQSVVTPIFGYKGMCMQASSNNTVQLADCSSKTIQEWAIYPDGTIRPSMSTTNCLASKSSKDGKIVAQHLCDGGDAERWLFNHDRTISDVKNNYVLEVSNDKKIKLVKRSADTPTSKQIFDIKLP